MLNKKRHIHVGVRLDDVEMEIIQRIQKYSGFTNLADSIRQCIRFTNVMFNDRLTIEEAVIPEMMDVILNDENFRKKTPICHVLKKVHQMEDDLFPQ